MEKIMNDPICYLKYDEWDESEFRFPMDGWKGCEICTKRFVCYNIYNPSQPVFDGR
jgi:hypothetical protein